MPAKIPPKQVIDMLASRRHRLRLSLWHAIRGAWNEPELTAETKALIRAKGWAPPNERVPFDANGKLILDNFSGEDFLYMHRQMISEVNDLLARIADPNYQRITPWVSIPDVSDSIFPVPPAWEYLDPSMPPEQQQRMTTRLRMLKGDQFLNDTMKTWEIFYTDRINLQLLSLGALGNMLEMTIHNNLHMRWASEPLGYMPSPNLDDTRDIDPKWDDPSYDYLGDTYSSHVNPHFWYLRGWVDACIDRWQEANNLPSIQWTGTWAGKLEDGWDGKPAFLGLKKTFETIQPMHGHGHDHGHDDADIKDMEEIVRALGSCKVIRNFYDELRFK